MISRLSNRPFLIYCILSCLAVIEVFLGPHRPIPFADAFDSWYIALKTIAENLWASGPPRWDPLSLTGNQAVVLGFNPFHPFSLLSLVLPLWAVYSLWAFFVCLVAGYGMHLFLSKHLRLSPNSVIVGSTLFFVVSLRTPHSDVFNYAFPFYLYLFQALLQEKQGRFFRGTLLFLILLSSFPPITVPYFPIFHLLVMMTFIRPFGQLKKHLIFFTLIWGIYACLHAPVFYSLLTETPFSHRLAFKRELFSFIITFGKQIASVLRDWPYPLLIVSQLAIISLFYRPSKRVLGWWSYLISFFLVFILVESNLRSPLSDRLPLISAFQWKRIFFLTYPSLLCVLSAYGFEFLEVVYRKNVKIQTLCNIKPKVILKYIFPANILISTSVLITDTILSSSWAHLIATLIKKVFYSSILGLLIVTLVLIRVDRSRHFLIRHLPSLFALAIIYFALIIKTENLLIFEQNRYDEAFMDPALKELVQIQHRDEPFRAVSLCRTESDCPYSLLTFHGIETPADYRPIYPIRYKQFWQEIITRDKQTECGSWVHDFFLWGNRVYLPRCPRLKSPAINYSLLSLMNVRFILSDIPPQDVRKVKLPLYFSPHESTPLFLYENKEFLPRVFVVSQWEIFEKEENLLERLSKKSAVEHYHSALLLASDIKGLTLPKNPHPSMGEAKIDNYSPHSVNIRATTQQPSILVLTDAYHKHWRAYINKRETPIFPVNYIFRGVLLPPGNATVEFIYNDPKLKSAYALSGLGLLLFILVMMLFPEKTHET